MALPVAFLTAIPGRSIVEGEEPPPTRSSLAELVAPFPRL